MSGVVLVTGVSRRLGGRIAGALAADPAVERVIGIDTVPPSTHELPLLGRTEFVRADIRNPLVATVLTQARVTTVVHAGLLAAPRAAGGRAAMQETNVIGTLQLLAACQRSDQLQRFVLRSSTAVYGCTSHDPAVFTERTRARRNVPAGFARDALETESHVRGFARRRPDVEVSLLRHAPVLGPDAGTAISRLLAGPVVPVPLGFDPRLQLLHEIDAVETLRLAATSARPGTVNVAGDGVVTLSQAIRRTGRIRVPVPTRAVPALAAALVATSLGTGGAGDLQGEDPDYLRFGRAVDTRELHEHFGYQPHYTTAETVAAFAAAAPPPTGLSRLAALSGGLTDLGVALGRAELAPAGTG